MSESGAGNARSSAVMTRRAVLAASTLGAAILPTLAFAAEPAFDPAQYHGKVVYLDFWASWCGPCQLSFPYMNRLVRDFSSDELVLRAVNVDHDKSRADAFLQHYGGQVPIVYDPSGQLAARYHVRAMPTSFLIGRDGQTRFIHGGFRPDQIAQYDADLEAVLHG